MSNKFFTSDHHFYHYNIIDLCKRFAIDGRNKQEANDYMTELLIERWNSKIEETDEVYHLGDFFWCGAERAITILDRLNGIKYWVRGNHDKVGPLEDQFVWVRDYYELKVHDNFKDSDGKIKQYHQPIVLCHFPLLSWNCMAHGAWHFHGHCHGSIDNTWNSTGLRKDVGVDTNDLYPYSYEELKNFLTLRTVVPTDHHKHSG